MCKQFITGFYSARKFIKSWAKKIDINMRLQVIWVPIEITLVWGVTSYSLGKTLTNVLVEHNAATSTTKEYA
jgi:hypothetical protein